MMDGVVVCVNDVHVCAAHFPSGGSTLVLVEDGRSICMI